VVSWDSKERGVRIGDSHTRRIYLGCTACRHWVALEMADALALFGNAYSCDIARRARCMQCSERKGYVMAWAEFGG
jgi:phage terminase large subunit GpA-like protein